MVSVFTVAAFRPDVAELNTAVLLFFDSFAGAAYCFLVNDIFDREKDVLNKKKRPIATGELPMKTAITSALFCVLGYLVISYLLGFTVFILALISLVLFTVYSPINNRGGFVANVLVAICASGSVWGVAIVRDYDASLFYLSLMIFFMILIREVLLDWLDISGDRDVGKRSIPIIFGTNQTIWIIILLLLITSGIVFSAPFLVEISDWAMYALCIALLTICVPIFILAKSPTEKNILFNIRFSHLTFLFIVVGILFR
ncbi:MAG: chlorophyll synthase [Cyclobacteriaceae bacterium]|jgi:chlorophyll synthase